jgi:Ca2+-binding RTX toxin-like protein
MTAKVTVKDLDGNAIAGPFDTLEAAIAAADAAGGGTISIGAGTLDVTAAEGKASALMVTTAIKIVGAGMNATTLLAQDSFGDGAMIYVTGEGSLDIGKLTIDGDGNDVSMGQALLYNGTSGEIKNVRFTDITGFTDADGFTGTAVMGLNGADLDLKRVTFDDIGRNGVVLQDLGTTASIEGLTYIGANSSAVLEFGITVRDGAHADMKSILMRDLLGGAPNNFDSTGIFISDQDGDSLEYGAGDAATATIRSLQVTNSNAAVVVFDFDGVGTGTVTVDFGGNVDVRGNTLNQHPLTPGVVGDVVVYGDAAVSGMNNVQGTVEWQVPAGGEEHQPAMIGGARGDDYLVGGDEADEIHGNAGNDELLGGAGEDALYGGRGDDEMTGGAGMDTFFFERGAGQTDTILDFDQTSDWLDLTALRMREVHMASALEEVGDDLVIHARAHGDIVLVGYLVANDAADIWDRVVGIGGVPPQP